VLGVQLALSAVVEPVHVMSAPVPSFTVAGAASTTLKLRVATPLVPPLSLALASIT